MHTLLLVVITATLSSITTMAAPTLVARLKRLKPRYKANKYKWGKHQLTIEQIFEQIEKRIELLNTQNSSFHNRVDEVEKYAKKRDSDRTSKTKKIVVDYLKELQK